MNILVITSLLAPYRIDWFEQLGIKHDVTVLYTKKSDIGRDSSWLRSKMISRFRPIFLRSFKIQNKEISFQIIKYLKTNKYDIVLFDGYGLITNLLGIAYLKLRKRDYFLNVDGGFSKSKESIIIKLIKKSVIKNAYILCSSKNTQEYVESYGAKTEKCFVHPFTSLMKNDISTSLLNVETKSKLQQELGMIEPHIIISVGQFIHRKGIDILINATKYLSGNIGVYIIGGKPTVEYLDLKNKLNLSNLHFVDFLNKDELQQYYQASDLFVLPTREDIWGLVINEAMAVGLPVITTEKCLAGLELVEDYQNGFIIPIENEKELANKIQIIMDNPQVRKQMSENSLKKIKRYNIENMSEIHINIFENYLKTHKYTKL